MGIVAFMAFGSISSAYADESAGVSGGITWTLNDGTLTVSPAGDSTEEGYSSGQMIDYKTSRVTPWYSFGSSVTKVVVNTGVTYIGKNSFRACIPTLEELTLSDTVESIGDYAFTCVGKSKQNDLKEIIIPSSVKTIGNSAFSYISTVKKVVFADNSQLESIEQYAFAGVGGDTYSGNGDADWSDSAELVDMSGCVNLKDIEATAVFSGACIKTFILPASFETFDNSAFQCAFGTLVIPKTMSQPTQGLDFSTTYPYCLALEVEYGSGLVGQVDNADALTAIVTDAIGSRKEISETFNVGALTSNGKLDQCVDKTSVVLTFSGTEKPSLYYIADASSTPVEVSADDITGSAEEGWTYKAPASQQGVYATVVNKPAATADQTTALQDATASATAAQGKVAISKDGSDVSPSTKWVTQEQADALSQAIAAAQVVLSDSTATAEETQNAQTALSEALAAFQQAQKAGTKPVPLAKGKTFTVKTKAGTFTYKVTGTLKVTLVKATKTKAKSVTVNTVKKNGFTYKVTAIGASAFKSAKVTKLTVGANVTKLGSKAFTKAKKLKTVTVKSKKLTKKSVKGSLKGSSVKTVKVNVGSKKLNKKYVKTYKKAFSKKNCGKKVTVK